VKWIRVLYSEFDAFVREQEHLISSKTTFDYIEGFVIINRTGLLNNWRSSFNPQDPVQAAQFSSEGKTLYCLEVAKYFKPEDVDPAEQVKQAIPVATYYTVQAAHLCKNFFLALSKFFFLVVQR